MPPLGLAVVVLAGAGLVACGDDSDDSAATTTTTTEAAAPSSQVSDVWARPVEDLTAKDTSAIYMVITGGSEDDALVKASVPADVAGTVELHETVAADDATTTTDGGRHGVRPPRRWAATWSHHHRHGGRGDDMGGGMMTMQPVESIPVPAGETVALEPGGYHVMLLDVKKVLAVGDTIDVTLTFEKAGEVTTTAEVREP